MIRETGRAMYSAVIGYISSNIYFRTAALLRYNYYFSSNIIKKLELALLLPSVLNGHL